MSVNNFLIDGIKFKSRLIMGTALYPNVSLLNKSLIASETQIITLAIRRLNLASKESFLNQLTKKFKLYLIQLVVIQKRSYLDCRVSQKHLRQIGLN